MSNQKGATKLATTQTLTGSYAVTAHVSSFETGGESNATLELQYTTGSGEVASYLSYIVEFSYDNSTWVQECQSSLSGGVDTQAPLTHKIAGGAGATDYSGHLYLGLVSRYLRIRVKEVGVNSNFGTVSITITTGSGSGMIHNIQPPAGGGGTSDVNLTQVGGAAVSLGQKTMANSIPVVLASDESALTISGSVTANAGTNLNTSLLALESGGNLAAIAASASVLDDWDESDRAKVNPIVGQAGVQGGSGIVSATTQRVVLATDVALPAGTNAIGKLSSNDGVDIGDVTINNASGGAAVNIQDGGNSITVDYATTGSGTATGALRVELPTNGTGVVGLNAGSNTIGAISSIGTSVVPGTGATNLGKAEDAAHTSGDTGVFSLGVANEAQSTFAADADYTPQATDTKGNNLIVGNLAHDAVDAGNPLKVGGKARTAQPAAVSASDRVDAEFDIYGRQIVMNALREMKGSQITTITSSTGETTVVTADATYKLDVYGVIVVNTSSTATEVSFKDSTSGTTRFWISVPANDMRGFMLPMDAGHNQNAVNNNWTGTCADSVASIIITMLFVKNL